MTHISEEGVQVMVFGPSLNMEITRNSENDKNERRKKKLGTVNVVICDEDHTERRNM